MKPIKLISYCPKEKRGCVRWVEKYFKDCLCNLNDDISFGLGLVSLVSWGVAEIPQIITNFGNKSGSGVSLAFLSTWIVGDIFNLVGCVLEPATLPTQFYTALLYTTTTVILVLQCIYYDHLLRWWNCKNIEVNLIEDDSKPLKTDSVDATKAERNSPVEVPHQRKFYYMSARSMAGSNTPPFGSYIMAKSGPSALEVNSDSSSEDETTHAPPKKYSQPFRIPRSVGYGTFLATSANLPFLSKALTESYLKTSGRRLLQGHEFGQENALGEWLGWLMAAIYMGGRVPQIWLNGLNPLMFILALIANATYTGSILVRTTEWEKTKANMPWLLDAVVCVVLDLFIILQYVYYRYIKIKKIESYNGHGGI
ncbi:hypothetical protein Vadar_015851 [Vaccinium darrowii]|uniref:Uncharacterized protein n=1 Tax=Vaccinium darrowii TaxID=229202 RepID=A0ACB7Y6U0_9ERIC|nr:hypothetical protein Vadar_015851 [Vaccinium darrowii]